jgi:hypothetical protein
MKAPRIILLEYKQNYILFVRRILTVHGRDSPSRGPTHTRKSMGIREQLLIKVSKNVLVHVIGSLDGPPARLTLKSDVTRMSWPRGLVQHPQQDGMGS